MNHRQRREMSKNLGIMQYQSKLSLPKRMELMRENITNGKKLQEEVAEETRRSVEEQLEEKHSAAIYSLSEFIAKTKGIPIIDAMKEAQKQMRNS